MCGDLKGLARMEQKRKQAAAAASHSGGPSGYFLKVFCGLNEKNQETAIAIVRKGVSRSAAVSKAIGKRGRGMGIKAVLTATIAIVSSAFLTGCALSTQSLESEPDAGSQNFPDSCEVVYPTPEQHRRAMLSSWT